MGWKVVCDECGARYSVSEDAAERNLRCRECGERVEAVEKKGKKRRGQPDIGIRIFGVLAVGLIGVNLSVALPLMLLGMLIFRPAGLPVNPIILIIALVYFGLCMLGIRGGTGKGLPITRSTSLEGTNAIVGGILLSGLVTMCNPAFLWILFQQKPGRPQPVVQVTPSSPANHSSPPSPAHSAVPGTPAVPPGPPAAQPAAAPAANAMSLTLTFTSFNGRGDAFQAADNATSGVGGVERVLRVNRADGKIVMLLAGGRFETGSVTTALTSAGFVMGPGMRIGPVESDDPPPVAAPPAATVAGPPAVIGPPKFDPNATYAIELKVKRYRGLGPPELVAKRQAAFIGWASGVLLFDEPQHRLVLQVRFPQGLPPPGLLEFRQLENAGFDFERGIQLGIWNSTTRTLQSPEQITVNNMLDSSGLPDAPDEFDMRMQFNERSPETLKKIREAVPKVKGVVRIVQLDANTGVAVVRIKRRICDSSEITRAMNSAGVQSIQSSFEPAGK